MGSTLPFQTMICVDFAIAWRTSLRSSWTSIGKIPTALAYDPLDNRGTPIAWGRGCADMRADEVKQCFKAFMGSPATVYVAKNKLWTPESPAEVHRWIEDYLHDFCRHAADTINTELGRGWRSGDVIWIFSVPGRWLEYPVVADFKRLAEEALRSCDISSNPRVEVLATEAEASAQSILSQGQLGADNCNERYAVGNVVISCDIGGATTDVAISEIVGPGKLASQSLLKLEPRGVVAFEQSFWEHTERILRSAGVQEPSRWALEMTKSAGLARARNQFSKSYGNVAIRLPEGCVVEDGQPSSQPGPSRDTTIQDGNLCIPSVVFEGFFTEFVGEIEEAIDEAINVLRCRFRNSPAVIGLCGGGSLMLYLQARLKARYEPSVPVACPDHAVLLPDLATSSGLGLVYDHRELSKFGSGAVFGVETSKGTVEWITGQEIPMLNSGFQRNSWVFTFTGKSRDKTVRHRFITVPAASQAPQTFKEAQQRLHSKGWEVEVDLYRDDRFVTIPKKYTIACTISQPDEIVFEARLKSEGQPLSCRSKRTEE
ncbi:hypothetical protein ONS96_002777 [Cadophora gregata f. sp. sojae]|nr:hypothetical protein ONS96_002777 [Cadophora gregata f. sp. sojae]